MVQKIYTNKPASTYQIPSNLQSKSDRKDGITYILVDEYRKSRCLSAVRAIGLSLLAVFIIPVAVKKFRATLKENWLATGKDKCQVEKYMFDDLGTKRTTSTSTTSTGKAEFSDAEIESIVSHGIPFSIGEMNISILKEKRKEFLDFMKNNRDLQKVDYQITDENQAVLEPFGLEKKGITSDNNTILATLRYMLLMGDIIIYRKARRGYRVALNHDGLKAMPFNKELTEKPVTMEVLLGIDKAMKQFRMPSLPAEFKGDSARTNVWNRALLNIRQELYERNLRLYSPLESPAHVFGQKIKDYGDVFDKLVSMKIIHAWNLRTDENTVFLQITPQDTIDNRSYVYPKWRDASDMRKSNSQTPEKPKSSEKKPKNQGSKKTKKTAETQKSSKQKKLSNDDVLRIVYNGFSPEEIHLKFDDLKRESVNILAFLKDKGHQKDYELEDSNQAAVDINSLRNANIKSDRNSLQATLRYMLLVGDIVKYQPARVGFRIALNKSGDEKMPKPENSAKPFTKDLLLEIDSNLKQFKVHPVPSQYTEDKGTTDLWNEVIAAIKHEMYQRNIYDNQEVTALKINNNRSSPLFHKDFWDSFVKLGIITSWNVSRNTACLKITPHDTPPSMQYVWDVWRDIETIGST